MNALIKKFLEQQKNEKGLSAETITNYEFYLNRFLRFAKIKSPERISVDLIKKYRLWLAKQTSGRYLLDKTTQNYHLIALRSFVRYLNEKKLCGLNYKNIFLDKTEKKSVNCLDLNEVEKLLKTPMETSEKQIVKLRDQAILELLFCSGIKVSEITILKKNDINLNQDEFMVYGKRQKPRICVLSNQAKFAIKKYLEQRKDKSDYLFVRHDRAKNNGNQTEHLTPRSLQRSVSYYGKLAGFGKKITPQTLRHTFTYLMFNEGAQTEQIQKLLGHTAITSTKQCQNLIRQD